jgi:hypothetical protein
VYRLPCRPQQRLAPVAVEVAVGLVRVGEPAVRVDDADSLASGVHRRQPLFPVQLPSGPLRLPADAVGQHRVVTLAGALAEVVIDPPRDGLGGDLLAPLPRVQQERDVGPAFPDRGEKGQSVLPRHIEIREDAVERFRSQPLQRGLGAGLAGDDQPLVDPLQIPADEVQHRVVIIDVEDVDGVVTR